jgi:hypothetical protein
VYVNVLALMAVTVQGLQLYFVAPVAILSKVPTASLAKSAADTVAVTVLPDFARAVIETDAAAPLVPGTVPLACTVAELLMELMIAGPVPSIASVIAAFEVSKEAADNSVPEPPQLAPEGQ